MSDSRSRFFSSVYVLAFEAIAIATFIYLMFFDGIQYNWWNWIVALPVNLFFSALWPVYWAIWRPLSALLGF